MPVAAGITSDVDRSAVGAVAHMPAEHSRAAGFDRAHHLERATPNVSATLLTARPRAARVRAI
jgi:hypothetical protein